jgi:hypothetical protein
MLAGGNATLSGVVVGTFTQQAGTLTLAFNAQATQARINQALSSLAYSNTSDSPPASVQLQWSFLDRLAYGAKDTRGTSTINITRVNDVPTGAVAISGVAVQGGVLTASHNLFDADGLGAISWQWLESGTIIAGANAPTLALTSAQLGKTISVRVTYTDSVGTAESVTSPATVPVKLPNTAPTGTVSILQPAGVTTPREDDILTASHTLADANGMGPVAWQWLADGQAITGETAATFTLAQSHVGKAISVMANYIDLGGTTESVTSAATALVVNVDDESSGLLSVTGTAEEGAVLTASLIGVSDSDGMTTTVYRWQQNRGTAQSPVWTDITGATDATLSIPSDQSFVGRAMRVVATTTDTLGGTTEFTSAGSTVTNVNDFPTGAVTVIGTPTQAQTLTATSSIADADGIPASGSGAIAYQWKADGAAISGATGSTFTLTQAQVGKTITVTASYTDLGGTAESVTSAATAAVVNVNDAPTGSVTISGTATRGQTLTAANTLADVDGIPTSGSGAIAYQWRADGAPISGATSSSFLLTQAQVGKAVSVTASYTDQGGTAESVTSAATTAVANVNDAPTGTVTITGTPTQGQTLTAANTLADVDGIPTSGSGAIAYQWSAGGVAINGATGSTLVLTQAQVGKSITLAARYTDNSGTLESVTSSATTAVANVNDAPTGTITITGTPTQGQTLTAANTLADVDGIPTSGSGAIAYQWRADGAPISGATSSSFLLTQAQVGKAVSVTASYTDSGGTTESVTSSATAAVTNVNSAPTGSVTISGTPTQGQTLTAANTLADADGIPTSGAGAITYQWSAGGQAISGATGSTLNLTQSLVGKAITLAARYTDNSGTLESVTSSATSAVANLNDAPTGAVSISGNASQRHSLLATNTLADVDGIPGSGPGAISYQWRANGSPISGATGSTFSLTPTQIGKVITVTASYTDLGGAMESITSPATEPIRGFREFWHDAVTRGMERPNPQALPFGQDLLMADTSYSTDLARLFGVPLEFGS